MPELILFAACEKVILDERRNATLINIMAGIEANRVQGPTGPIPKNAVAGSSWSIFSLWKPKDGDVGKEFTQKITIIWPDNSEFKVNDVNFKMEKGRNHQNNLAIVGFPIGQVGDVRVNMWLEWDRKQVGEIHTWIITVTHAQPQN
jgi:hypothetical protein